MLLCASCLRADAHVGSPNVFFDGQAGAYPVHVVIRPPNVIPGRAEIIVRVATSDINRVTVLPVFWQAGRHGAPPADEAKRIRGQPNLYSAMLWLMKPGAYCVDVNIEGTRGMGHVNVPVNAVATNTRPMSLPFRTLLGSLGILLLVGAVKIVGVAFGESVVEPDASITRQDQWRGRFAMGGGFILFTLIILSGKRWWEREAAEYRNNRLYKATRVDAAVGRDGDQSLLTLSVDTATRRGRWTPLIPDHGKIMHLFLVAQPDSRAFAHLHPIAQTETQFAVPLPSLPPGTYELYADVTHENGFSETLTAAVMLPPAPPITTIRGSDTPKHLSPDPDDSWLVAGTSDRAAQHTVDAGDGYLMRWENFASPIENQETSLRFQLIPPQGESATIEPYMGMPGHAAIRRSDGAVFAHIHPVGNFSMASQEFFERANGPGKTTSASTPGPVDHSSHFHADEIGGDTVSFPYEFPQAGRYRLWVQMKSHGKVLTGVFDTEVRPAR